MPGPNYSQVSPVYATDEDIAIRSYGAFGILVPSSQTLAYGTDGVISAGNLWVLTSATVNFAAQGVGVGHVVLLTKPTNQFKGSGRYLAVSSVSGNSLTMRFPGKPDGVGQPPVPAGGLTGIEFRISTFDPQIETTSYQINQQFGVSADYALTSPSYIHDTRVLNQATVLTVLHRAYVFMPITAAIDYTLRIAEIASARDDAIDQIRIRWGGLVDTQPSSSVIGMRIERA
jgi:hypothetical protein